MKCYECMSSTSYVNLPIDQVELVNRTVVSHFSSPDTGIEEIDIYDPTFLQPNMVCNDRESRVEPDNENLESLKWLGLKNWMLHPGPNHSAFGVSISLYEPLGSPTSNNPIVDTFTVLERPNNAVLLMADGIHRGINSRRASCCAVRATLNYLNKYLCSNIKSIKTTHNVFKIMVRGFEEAQKFIVERKAGMTTLCCSVVLKLASDPSLYVVCTLSVGNSTAYVYNRDEGVLALTQPGNIDGALNSHPNSLDPCNSNFSVMYIKKGDIVFLLSDGVSDNFDPIVSGKHYSPCLLEKIFDFFSFLFKMTFR
jgi:hypothetical protein